VITAGSILAIVPWWLPQLSLLVAALIATTACFLGGLSFWRIGWLAGKRTVRKAAWATNGEWRIVDDAGASWPATLLPASRVMGGLVWLRFASEWGRRDLLFVGSDLAPLLRRRLITRLRLQGCQHKVQVQQAPGRVAVAKGLLS
jgi:hypothetical protein